MVEDKLKQYNEKRNFDKTPEPGSQTVSSDWAEGRPIFVIQKRDATNLHYDFDLVRQAVLEIRDMKRKLDLIAWFQTTGSQGSHVVPQDRSEDFNTVRGIRP